MGVTYNKNNNLRYTQLCMFIDAHMKEVTNSGENPALESTIYQYLYHIIYALARKSCYFKNFEDYDKYALYAASEIYISMRKKYEHEGEEQRGKQIVPVKSCLNFIKFVMPKLKVNYQNSEFTSVTNPKTVQSSEEAIDKARAAVQAQYRKELAADYEEAIPTISWYIKRYLARSPFRNDSKMVNNLYISTLLTLTNSITLPYKLHSRLNKLQKAEKSDKLTDRLSNSYKANDETVILWHLDPGFSNFVLVLSRKAKSSFAKEFREIRTANDFSDDMLDAILSTAYPSSEEVD